MSVLSGGEGDGTRAEMNALVFTLFTDSAVHTNNSCERNRRNLRGNPSALTLLRVRGHNQQTLRCANLTGYSCYGMFSEATPHASPCVCPVAMSLQEGRFYFSTTVGT